eukprot:7326063-Prymnesium_polylepis.1
MQPSGSVAAHYAAPGERLGPTTLPPDVAQFIAGGHDHLSVQPQSSYTPYKPAPTPPSAGAVPAQ